VGGPNLNRNGVSRGTVAPKRREHTGRHSRRLPGICRRDLIAAGSPDAITLAASTSVSQAKTAAIVPTRSRSPGSHSRGGRSKSPSEKLLSQMNRM